MSTQPKPQETTSALSERTLPIIGKNSLVSTHTQILAEIAVSGDNANAKVARRLKVTGLIAATVLLLLATAEMVAWALDIHWLKHPTDQVALQSAASINFFLISVSTIVLCFGPERLITNMIARGLAVIVLIGSTVEYVEHTCHLFMEPITLWQPPDASGLTYPGPLIPNDSMSFMLLSVAVLMFNLCIKKKFWPTQMIALLVAVPSFIFLCFYLMGQEHFCIYFGCVKLSPINCLAFVLAGYSLIFSSPQIGMARPFTLKTTAGTIARRTLAGIGIVVLLLLPRQWIAANLRDDAGNSDVSTANAVCVVMELLGMGIFGWWCFRRIEKEQSEKQQAIEQMDQKIELLQKEMTSSPATTRRLKLVCLECVKEFSDETLTHCPHDNTELTRIADDEEIKPGTMFADRYRIERELGSGGMSTVYLAHHMLMNKDVALKVLHTHYATDAKNIQRFQREARAASSFSHPNLVGIFDFSVTAQGQAYMVMEFLQGFSLGEFLNSGKPIPWREAVPLFIQICDGIEHAHERGVIHRDMKPGNIMLLPSTEKGQMFLAKIVDFGIAKVVDDRGAHLTQTGEVFGSPLYMSPEQCQGLPLGATSDIYAVGCIMYSCLAGRPPFEGANIMNTLAMHLNEPPPAIPPELEVPEWLETIVQRAMAKEPTARYQSAKELSTALTFGPSYNASN